MSKSTNPYKAFEKTDAWRVLDRGIKDLVKNGDVEEHTARQYIVGYLTKLLSEAGISETPKVMKVVELRGDEQLIVRARKVAG